MESLKVWLLQLPPTGGDGFEGLMASVLTDIVGTPFRVAAGGSQFGSDGNTSSGDDGVYFECKRYRNTIPRSEILSKIAELSIRSANVDAWFLCATSEVSAQIAHDVQELGRKNGIATFILDWTGALPLLALALAISSIATRHLSADASASAEAALGDIRAHSSFNASAEQLRRDLREPLVGTEIARQANAARLMAAFADSKRATREFGEPLSPLDESFGPARPRPDLVAEVQTFLTGAAAATSLCVLGGEGAGKSWLVAHSWCRVDRKPLMVVLSPRHCDAIGDLDDCEAVLACELARQAGSSPKDVVVAGWCRKLARWRRGGRLEGPGLIVVIDGVNQRPATDWARVIDAFDEALGAIGARLVVTVRTTYYETRLKPRLLATVRELNVPEWTEAERDEILAEHGIGAAALPLEQDRRTPVPRALLNPRLLGIAVRLLKGRVVERLAELSTSHLLFEHLRTGARENRTPEPAYECVRRLRRAAQEVLLRIQDGVTDDLAVFEAQDVQAVADGRFFLPVDGDPTRYELQDDGLILALGLAVIDRLRAASRNKRDLTSEFDAAVDPIAALDQTAAIVMAAVTCVCIDATQDDEITVALLRGFAELQNPNHDDLDAFTSLARTRTRAFVEAARHLCLAGWQQPNADGCGSSS